MSERALTSGLFVRMVREEYRLHAELFGDRFAVFPLLTLALSAGGVWLLGLTGTSLSAVGAGLHGLVFFFGLQVGTVGLIGGDAISDRLGGITLLIYSARTLPVTLRRLLAVFLVKDLVYYSVLFVGPVIVGYGAVAVTGGAPPASVGLLWLTATASFGLGVGTSLTLTAVGSRWPWAVPLVVVGVASALLWEGFDVVTVTPIAFYDSPTVETAVVGFGSVLLVVLVGGLLFEPDEGGPARTTRDRYDRLRSVLGDGIATRSILEVLGSRGSVWKVLFSMGVLFGVTAALVVQVSRATTLDPSMGIAVGTLLGLGAFTTYSWTTVYDDVTEYRRYPVSMQAVFAGKRRAYLLLAVPAGLVYLVGSLVWIPAREVATGAVVFVLVTVYVFGLTAYVAGLAPNELLFDTLLFLVFGGALTVVAVPLVVAALAAKAEPTIAPTVAVGVALVAALVGLGLARRAGPRWDDRTRME